MSETFLLSGNNPKPGEVATLDKKAAIARHIVGSVGKLFPQTKLKVKFDFEKCSDALILTRKVLFRL